MSKLNSYGGYWFSKSKILEFIFVLITTSCFSSTLWQSIPLPLFTSELSSSSSVSYTDCSFSDIECYSLDDVDGLSNSASWFWSRFIVTRFLTADLVSWLSLRLSFRQGFTELSCRGMFMFLDIFGLDDIISIRFLLQTMAEVSSG
jgi:hypothetical protein